MKSKQIKVSIIVPVYNVELYIEKSINSLIAQTLYDIEIIIIDDGSCDSSSDICDKFQSKDERIKVIHKHNEGLGYARNTGIDIAKGEYIGFVDSDDYVSIDMYEKLYNEAKLSNSDIVLCNHNVYKNNGDIESYSQNKEYLSFCGEYIKNQFIKNMIAAPLNSNKERLYYMSVWRGIYNRKLFDNVRFLSERDVLSEDLLLYIDIFPLCNKITLIPDNLYFYRENLNSLTNSYRPDRVKKTLSFYELVKFKLESQFPLDRSWQLRLYKLLYGYMRFAFKLNLRSSITKTKILSIKNDFVLMCDYFYNIGFFNNYPINNIPFKHKILLLSVKYRLFLLFTLLIKKSR